MPDRPPAEPSDEALDRYWTTILAGAEASPESDLDPALAATVRRVHALDTPPAPQPAFATMLWENLMHAQAMPRVPDPPSPGQESAPMRRQAPAGRSWWPAQSRWPLAQIATALLLLVTLGLALVALRPLPGSGPAPLLPAVVAPATATPVVSGMDTLLAISVPPGMIPAAGMLYGDLTHFTLPPGTAPAHLVGATWDASIGECCPGLRFEYVLDGIYTVRPDGPVRVVRADGAGTPEAAQAGHDLILGPGDALLSPSEATFTAANTGAAPVELLTAVLTTRPSSTNEIPAGWTEHDLDSVYDVTLPHEALVLRLRRAELAPKMTLPPLPRIVGLVAVTLSDTAVLGKQIDGGLRNISERPVEAYVLTLERSATATSTPGAGTPTP